MKKYTFEMTASKLVRRAYSWEEEHSDNAAAESRLARLGIDGLVPDDVEFTEEMDDEDLSIPAVNGSEIKPIAICMESDTYAGTRILFQSTIWQRAFFWSVVHGALNVHPCLRQKTLDPTILCSIAIEMPQNGILIAQPTERDLTTSEISNYPLMWHVFEYDGRNWEVLFTFKDPRT